MERMVILFRMVVLLILPICLFVCLGMRKAEKPVERPPTTEAIKMLNNPNDHSEIARLFDKLRSPSEWKRERAKRQFLKLGPAAISPLLDFLRDLTSNRVPRFRTGEEQQGQAALETYCSLLAREGSRSPHLEEAGARLDNLAINYRLSSDIIALLGELKAEEAVPFLIKRMVYVGIDDPYAITEEIKALQAIGLAAVPYLMKEIREIESKVRSSSIEEVNFNYRIGCELHIESKEPDPERVRIAQRIRESLRQNRSSESEIQMRVEFVQARILMIFEEMRDRRTLPYLEELVKETTDQALITWIQRTMNSIKSPYPPRTIVVLPAKPENSH